MFWGCNPLLDKWLAEERMKDAMREAEQARLIRGSQRSQEGAEMAAAGGVDPQQSVGSLHATAELMNHAAGLGQSHRARPGQGARANLRRMPEPSNPHYLVTVRGRGYKTGQQLNR